MNAVFASGEVGVTIGAPRPVLTVAKGFAAEAGLVIIAERMRKMNVKR